MKFFADTADTAEIADLAATGLLDGVTTNPSLIHKSGRKFVEVVAEICALTDGPVSAEVVALDHAGMMREADILRAIADNVCIKVPLTVDGLKTCKALSDDGTMVNVTLCFSATQALLAAKAGLAIDRFDLFTNPLTNGHVKTERLLRLLPHRWVDSAERLSQQVPGFIGRKLLVQMGVRFRQRSAAAHC